MRTISAVVPTLNNELTVGKCLEGVLTNRLDEVVLVDGGSTDKTLKIASSYRNVTILTDVEGVSKAKDIGWRTSRGELVLFTDADAYIEEGTVNLLCSHIKAADIAGVSCRVACANPRKMLARLRDFDFRLTYEEQFRNSTVIDCVADPTVCGLFRREALEDVGGFDLNYPYAEDLELLGKLRRRGYRVLMLREPAVAHYHREKYSDLYRQFYGHGFGRGMLIGETRQRFYSGKNPIEFAVKILRNAAKEDPKLLFSYPFYRVFTETAFLMGYVHGRKRSVKAFRA